MFHATVPRSVQILGFENYGLNKKNLFCFVGNSLTRRDQSLYLGTRVYQEKQLLGLVFEPLPQLIS